MAAMAVQFHPTTNEKPFLLSTSFPQSSLSYRTRQLPMFQSLTHLPVRRRPVISRPVVSLVDRAEPDPDVDSHINPFVGITLVGAPPQVGGFSPLLSTTFHEVDKDNQPSTGEDLHAVSQQKVSELAQRIVFGLAIDISAGGVVLAGGWAFTLALASVVFTGAQEYFELVRSRGISDGMTPPPQYVSRVCSVICALLPIFTWYIGHIDVSVTSAAFVVAMALLLQRGIPRFSQLSSTMFGLFFCGYLPCFWVKLRCGLSTPALNSRITAGWPILLGGQTHWTVGLVASLITLSSIIAADTYAFMGGKMFGRTPLTQISPKKTWEGTIIGLGGCIATSVLLMRIFCWPTSLLSSITLGFLTFIGSIFGDLTESMIKRDAGVKDSGSLIPGHGGMLDRVDSYIFTGALVYNFVKLALPLYGV